MEYGTIFFGVFHGELDVQVQGVYVQEELMTMFCMFFFKLLYIFHYSIQGALINMHINKMRNLHLYDIVDFYIHD